MTESFLTLYVDPGENTGWCIGQGMTLLAAGQTPMWEFADNVWDALADVSKPFWNAHARDDVSLDFWPPIKRIVCEDFRIYPWKAKDLAWDQVRTARLIGALTFMARNKDLPFILQGAKIKDEAVAGGAEELFYVPLHENRHQNDAIMHFVYYSQMEILHG